MPTYEYLCENCAYRFEKREGFDAPARQKCEKCRRNTAQRMLFAPPIVFKGSGFYRNDSRGADTSETSSNGSGKSDDAAAAPAAAAASTDHGHTHGPGGHSDTSEATPAPAKPDKPEKSKSANETPKPAAAG